MGSRSNIVGKAPALFGAAFLVACAAGSPGIEVPVGDEALDVALAPTLGHRLPPIALHGEDGTPIHLRRLGIRGQVDGLLGMTELTLVFDNQEGRSLDGLLGIALPADARVVRFAIGEETQALREAEVVPRREAYGALVERAMDPALLSEGAIGERLRIRVPRIPPGELRVVVGYVEELRGRERPYRLALAGLSRLEVVDVRVDGVEIHGIGPGELHPLADGGSRYLFRGEGTLEQDIVIHAPELRSQAIRHERQVIARVAPVPHDHGDEIPSLTVLFDTSASQVLGFDAQIESLGALITALRSWTSHDIPLRVIGFDQTAETLFEGRISGFGERHLQAIRRRGALGASDLVSALRYAGSQPSRSYERLLVVTDGVLTAGAGHAQAIRSEVARLAEVGVKRADVIGLGVDLGRREPLLAAISRAGLERDGLILRAELTPEVMLRKLRHRVHSGIRLAIPGSAWVYPERVDGIQADDTVLVYAELEPEAPLELVLDGAVRGRSEVRSRTSAAPRILDNAWHAAHIRWMEDQLQSCGEELCEQWRRRITDTSLRHRIVNEVTALVMVGGGDERRFGLDPEHLAALLAFGRDGAMLKARSMAAPATIRAVTHALRPDPALPEIRKVEVASAEPPDRDTLASPRAPEIDVSRRPRPVFPALGGPEVVLPALPEPSVDRPQLGPRRQPADAYDGALLTVMDNLRIGDLQGAQRRAELWRDEEPANVLALIALGEALEGRGRREAAARAYGSIIDLYPMRPELRRLAASRLERLGEEHRWLILDSYARALRGHSDDPSSHRLLGYALLRIGYYREAFDTVVSGLAWARSNPRSQTIARVLYEDLGLIAAAWIAARPEDEAFVRAALEVQGVELASEPSLRFVLTWDTPISDVDLHVRDGDGHHAFYKNVALRSGGRLYGDIAVGQGVEAFVIDGEAEAFPYNLQIGYYTLDPRLGYGMGKVEIIAHDGHGTLTFDQRPFVVSRDGGTVDLGTLTGPPLASDKR